MEQQFEGRPRAEWWIQKIRRNVERDREVTSVLEGDGWHVMRFWDAEVTADPDNVAERVEVVVRERVQSPENRTTR
jgi:DNA mismatch endonuclease (patch repair protein)